MEQAILAARDVDPGMPVIAQMTIGVDGLTSLWRPARRDRARARPVRCGRHWAQLLGRPADDSRRDRAHGAGHPTQALRPAQRRNAARGRRAQHVHGEPRVHGDLRAPPVQAGAKVVGGCCGTTPAHIHAIADSVRSARAATASRRIRTLAVPATPAHATCGRRPAAAACPGSGRFPRVPAAPPRPPPAPSREVVAARRRRAFAPVPSPNARAGRPSSPRASS